MARASVVASIFVVLPMAMTLACSDGDGNADGPTFNPTSPPPPGQVESEFDPNDLLLQINDFPTGWIDRGAFVEGSLDIGTDCGSIKFDDGNWEITDSRIVDAAKTGIFVKQGEGMVTSAASLFESADKAEEFLESYQDDLTSCRADLEAGIAHALEDDAQEQGIADSLTNLHVTLGEMSFKEFGDRSHSFSIQYGGAVNGRSFEYSFDVFAVRVGSALANLTYASAAGSAVAEEERLLGALADRMSLAMSSSQ